MGQHGSLCSRFACFTGTKVRIPTQKLKADTLAQAVEGAEVVASLAAGLKADVEKKLADEREVALKLADEREVETKLADECEVESKLADEREVESKLADDREDLPELLRVTQQQNV